MKNACRTFVFLVSALVTTLALSAVADAQVRDRGGKVAERPQERVKRDADRVDGKAREAVRDASEEVGDEVRDEVRDELENEADDVRKDLEDEADELREELENEAD